MVLREAGFDVDTAENGRIAVEKVQSSPEKYYDAILMDIKMPNMNGLEATREIRKLNTCIPIIVVSAFAFDSDKQEARQAGCTDYLVKPIDSRLLKETLKKYLP